MNRYLLKFSYIGTSFRGIQKTIRADSPLDDKTSVQGCLELGLKGLQPANPIRVVLSSRTDAGVHALQTSVHVDLESKSGYPYSSGNITYVLNRYFNRQRLPIRIHSAQRVSEDFHSRYNARARTYLYRFAIAKQPKKKIESLGYEGPISYIPIEERDRCFFIQHEFDVERFKEAAKLFVGRHDFRTFMGKSKQNSRNDHPMYALRTISEIIVRESFPVTCSLEYEKASQLYNYWDIEITGRSFLYKQVRRMVATLFAVAFGNITINDTYEMLTIPSRNSWNTRIEVVPAFALYLCKVHYDEEDLKFTQEESEELREVEIKL